MVKVKISTDYITLGQFLKFTNIIAQGSDAKNFLLYNEVLVNQDAEQRRGRKLYKDDVIEVLGNKFIVDED